MSRHDIIVVGASAGGVEALCALVGALPAGLPASLFVVVHVPAAYPSVLPALLGRAGVLPAAHACDGDSFLPGHIYIAPPDHHLLLEGDLTRLSRAPRENHSRPAVDVLFRSAAVEHGPRVVGVILSGMLYDGTSGLTVIKDFGGATVVQDPDEARFSSMPRSAISRDHPDYVLPLAEIALTLVRLALAPADSPPEPPPGARPRARLKSEAVSESESKPEHHPEQRNDADVA